VHCQQVCQQLGVSCALLRVNVQQRNGQSLEAQARNARYQAFTELTRERDMLLLAHHRDDQAETLLLQLLRGAGVKGLAAMPACTAFSDGWLARPLLEFSRAQLLTYARERQLDWIEDPSNQDPAFDRNYLRHRVMPLLYARWPSASASLARAAGLQAEAAQLLEQLAQQDLEDVRAPEPHSLLLAPLRRLPAERQRNLLRYWLVSSGLPLPAAVQLRRIQTEILMAAQDACPKVHWPGAEVRRYRDRLYAMPPLRACASDWRQHWDLHGALALPTGERLESRVVQGRGLRETALAGGVEIRYRCGGERCRLPGRAHHHSLKKLFQTWGVPSWQRDRIALVYIGEELAQVVGFCVCAPFAVGAEEAGREIIYRVGADAIETAGENKDNNPGCTP
jgi:tRNA(Ile)-lysidine synthase